MHDLNDSWTLPSVSKERAVIIFADSDTSIGLRFSQMPRSSKVAFFCANDDRRRRQTEPTTRPLAHARGVIITTCIANCSIIWIGACWFPSACNFIGIFLWNVTQQQTIAKEKAIDLVCFNYSQWLLIRQPDDLFQCYRSGSWSRDAYAYNYNCIYIQYMKHTLPSLVPRLLPIFQCNTLKNFLRATLELGVAWVQGYTLPAWRALSGEAGSSSRSGRVDVFCCWIEICILWWTQDKNKSVQVFEECTTSVM